MLVKIPLKKRLIPLNLKLYKSSKKFLITQRNIKCVINFIYNKSLYTRCRGIFDMKKFFYLERFLEISISNSSDFMNIITVLLSFSIFCVQRGHELNLYEVQVNKYPRLYIYRLGFQDH